VVPSSFVALFLAPGRTRPSAPRAEIAARHEFCEDLATLLTDTAATRQWELGVTPADVLERVHRGLLGGAAGVSAARRSGWSGAWQNCWICRPRTWKPGPSRRRLDDAS